MFQIGTYFIFIFTRTRSRRCSRWLGRSFTNESQIVVARGAYPVAVLCVNICAVLMNIRLSGCPTLIVERRSVGPMKRTAALVCQSDRNFPIAAQMLGNTCNVGRNEFSTKKLSKLYISLFIYWLCIVLNLLNWILKEKQAGYPDM